MSIEIDMQQPQAPKLSAEDIELLGQMGSVAQMEKALRSKPTNPKDAIGSTKLPLNLVPSSLVAYAALSFLEGAAKYGSHNWRGAGVRASIYKAAMERHMLKWWSGEWADPKTGVPHLASVIACAGIILDARLVGKLTDDRPPSAPISGMIDGMEEDVKRVLALFAENKPHHWTIADDELIRLSLTAD